MQDEDKTKSQLIAELQQIRQRVSELEQAKNPPKSAETALRQSEEQIQLALLGTDLGLWDWHVASGQVSCDQYRRDLLGYTAEGFKSTISAWKKLIHPDDLPRVTEKVHAHFNGKTSFYESEYRVLAKDDTWLWLLDRGKVIERDEEGNPVRMLGSHLDITERKRVEEELRESEEKYRSLINGMLDTVWVIDFEGKFVDVNSAAVDALGYTYEELLAMGPVDIDLNLTEEAIKDLIDAIPSDEIQVFETSHTTKDGRQIPVEIQSCIIKYQGKDAILSIGRDITDRKRAEEERLKLKKLESVGVLAGGIAHDFNNVLTSLFGNIEMAKMFVPVEHKSYKFLENAMCSMENATYLTNRLLTFAKGGDPIKEVLSIGDVIFAVARHSMRDSNFELNTNIDLNLWSVEADRDQLGQVISNLVLNAQQAMPTGGIITIAAENVETLAGKFVQITIQDQGMGIAPQHIENIFDPYFTTKKHSSGLGLAISHSIINKHNGTITVASTLNQGTIFTIHLPAVKNTEVTMSEKSGSDHQTISAFSANILVMDDEEGVRAVLGAMLEMLEHTVTFSVDGKEAVNKYREAYQQGSIYDVVIVDLTIPAGMGGQVTAQEILKLDPHAKLIVSSGYATDPVMANYKAYGFKGRVVKPYSLAELKKAVDQVLKM